LPPIAVGQLWMYLLTRCHRGKPPPTVDLQCFEELFQAKKMPRTWRGIFMREAYRPSSIALLRTAPLSALVASRA